jgi:hypothetical protein
MGVHSREGKASRSEKVTRLGSKFIVFSIWQEMNV